MLTGHVSSCRFDQPVLLEEFGHGDPICTHTFLAEMILELPHARRVGSSSSHEAVPDNTTWPTVQNMNVTSTHASPRDHSIACVLCLLYLLGEQKAYCTYARVKSSPSVASLSRLGECVGCPGSVKLYAPRDGRMSATHPKTLNGERLTKWVMSAGNQNACNVLWVYRPEDKTRMVK
jgi:hypothetical protein